MNIQFEACGSETQDHQDTLATCQNRHHQEKKLHMFGSSGPRSPWYPSGMAKSSQIWTCTLRRAGEERKIANVWGVGSPSKPWGATKHNQSHKITMAPWILSKTLVRFPLCPNPAKPAHNPRSPWYHDVLVMRNCRQVGSKADKRQDLHGTMARGGRDRLTPNDCISANPQKSSMKLTIDFKQEESY